MTILPVKLSVIHSRGGARGDFLAGWLGTLPQFIQNYWSVDCETGQSISSANFLKHFKPKLVEADFEKFLEGYNLNLDHSSELRVSATTHRPDIGCFFPPAKRNCVQLIAIQISESDYAEIEWNFFVKTFLTKHRQHQDFTEKIKYGVDRYFDARSKIDDEDRLEKIDALYSGWSKRSFFQNICIDPDVVFVYSEIFKPGGSRRLSAVLDFQCNDAHHTRWDTMITVAGSPKIIERFGRVFRFDDFRCSRQI